MQKKKKISEIIKYRDADLRILTVVRDYNNRDTVKYDP